LIVDDSPTIVSILRKILEPYGYNIKTASSGEEALKVIFHSLPDLILMDVTMQGIDGFETCKRIKSNRLTAGIPILFVTSENSSENSSEKKAEGFNIGAVDFLTKPFSADEILARVRTHLELRGLIQQHERLIMDLREMNEKLDTLSKTDTLTQLSNRRDILTHLDAEKNRFERSGMTFSLIIADIDHFKKFNDTYGHEAGDCILKEVSDLLRQNTRPEDTVARWGGEEFLILLPNTKLKGAETLATKLKNTINKKSFSIGNSKQKVTLSFGVNTYQGPESIDECIKKADECLYTAKKKGRNQVVANN
jgi:diguanylate cyclase (GGDEF)-like protein